MSEPTAMPHPAQDSLSTVSELGRSARRMLVALALPALAACSILNIDPLPAPGRAPPVQPSSPGASQPGAPAPSAPSRPRSDASSATRELLAQSRAARTAGNYPQATAVVERALRLAPNDPYLWLELGEIALAMGDTKQAATLARKAQSLASDDRAVTAQAERLLRASGTR